MYSAQKEASGLNQKSAHMPLCQIEVNCMRTPHALSQCNKAVKKKGKEVMIPGLEQRKAGQEWSAHAQLCNSAVPSASQALPES